MVGASVPAGTAAGGHAALAACVTTGGQTVCTASGGAGVAAGLLIVVYLAILVLFVVGYVKIISKAGYSGWWVLIALVPLVNMVMFLVFAFSEWPVHRELARLQATRGYVGGYGTTPWGARAPAPSSTGFGTGVGAAPTAPERPREPEVDLPPFGQGRPGSVPGATGTESGTPSAPGSPPDAGTREPAGQAPPGWYPVPDGRRRYWDGSSWTDHFA